MPEMSNQAGLVLFHAVPSRSTIVRWMLEEIGVPYDIALINLSEGDHLKPDYRKINPKAKVPALRHGDTIITEVSAICAYLADEFSDSGLAPKIGDKRRGPYLSWLFYAPSCIEPALIANSLGWSGARPGMLGWGDYKIVLKTLREAAMNASPYLLGRQFTAADVVIGSQIRFGHRFKLLPGDPAFSAYLNRLEERPALQRQIAKDKALADSQA